VDVLEACAGARLVKKWKIESGRLKSRSTKGYTTFPEKVSVRQQNCMQWLRRDKDWKVCRLMVLVR
jgi:hypothetical protein